MKRSPRLSSEERRAAIMMASLMVFAEKGCDSATTRELAQAAGVSEALLYKHFASKASLFEAICEGSRQAVGGQERDRLLALPPSAETLIGLVRLTIEYMVAPSWCWINYRLYLRSLIENGDFARKVVCHFDADIDYYAASGGWSP